MSTNGESNCDKSTCESPPRYPVYRQEAAELKKSGPVKKGTAIPSSGAKTRTSLSERFVADSLDNGSSMEEIARILVASNCQLSDVVGLRNAQLSRAFLQEKLLRSGDESDRGISWVDVYSLIDADTRDSVDLVMNTLDLANAEVILTYGPDRDLRRRHFFHNFVSMAMDDERRDWNDLKIWLQDIVKWNILDEEGSRLIEQRIFQEGSKDLVCLFLQHQLDYHVKRSVKTDVLAALFGNLNFKIGATKRKRRVEANAAGFDNFTALHYAMKSKQFKKVKYLVDRGADPNARTKDARTTPLMLALLRPTEDPAANARCVELLLQHGADPFSRNCHMVRFSECTHVVRPALARAYPVYAGTEYLVRLTVAQACAYGDGKKMPSDSLWGWISVREDVEACGDLADYQEKCQRELDQLCEREVRRGLTMFAVVSKTGRELARLLNAEDAKIIGDLIDKCDEDETVNAYYVKAMRGHMRQYRKIVAHRNRAMRVISQSARVLAPHFVVLNKIVGYLTYKDLLMFQ